MPSTIASASISGIYEHPLGWAVRMRIRNCPERSTAKLRCKLAEKKQARFYLLGSQQNTDATYTLDVSMIIPAECYGFKLLHGRNAILEPDEKQVRQLVIQRNLAMVNPEIDGAYRQWIEENPLDAPVQSKQANLVSIVVPLFNTPVSYLHDMIGSVLGQSYKNWELVLVNASPNNQSMRDALGQYDDGRIAVYELSGNLGIAGNTNEGIRRAKGDYVAFLDHDDMVDPNLLAVYMNRAQERPDTDLFYCDEDNFYESLQDRYAPRFKPDFNLGLLHSHNYIVHCLMVSQWVLGQIELSPDYTSGAQDYDLSFKAAELARQIYHAPYVLYHWRNHPDSTNGGDMNSKPYAIEAGRRAIEDHYRRTGRVGKVKPSWIPCVYDTSYEYGSYLDYCELELIDEEPYQSQISSALASEKAAYFLVRKQGADATTYIKAQLVATLNDPSIGVAAAKLFSADGLVADCGVVYDDAQGAHLLNTCFTDDMGGGYLGLAECVCDYSATTANCFAIRRDDLEKLASSQAVTVDAALAELEAEFVANGKRSVINPNFKGTVDFLPRAEGLSAQTETCLHNPNLEFASGYARLKVNRNMDVEAESILAEEMSSADTPPKKQSRFARLFKRGI